jgi:hypothetical protein
MQIHEITYKRTVNEAAGSLAGQASVAGSGFMGALTNKMLPGANTNNTGTTTAPTAAQGKAAELSAPAVAALATNQQKLWTVIVQDLMKKTRGANGQTGVLSISEIPPQELKNALLQQVNTKILSTASGRALTDYNELPGKVDPASFGGKAVQLSKQFVNDINVSMDVILSTEPTKANAAKTQEAWNNLVGKIYQASNMVEFQGGGGAVKTKAAAPNQMTQKAQQAGLTASQQGVKGVNIKSTGNAQADALLQAVGLQTPATQPTAVTAE